jgi:hypothetical protein
MRLLVRVVEIPEQWPKRLACDSAGCEYDPWDRRTALTLDECIDAEAGAM